jgi:hypothetical protein
MAEVRPRAEPSRIEVRRVRLLIVLATLALTVAALPANGAAQSPTSDSAAAARRANLRAAMAAAKARADSAATLVKTLVVTPTYLELRVGDSVFSRDVYKRLDVRGVTATGDTISEFAKSFALEPSPYLEQRGHDLLPRRPGIATLWIYLGSRPALPLFADTTGVARVQLRVK